jgi:hypothetical protein
VPIKFDLEFFQGITLPPEWKKIGTMDGIDRPIVKREGGDLQVDQNHPLVALYDDVTYATYVQGQIASFNAQLRAGLRQLFPYYYSLQEANITWRLCETVEEGIHMDVFAQGAPTPPHIKDLLRVKLFINIDTQPRRWRTSMNMPAVLKACHGKLPDELPDDVNVVADLIDKFAVLEELPYHEVDYPTMSAVIVNAEVVAHEVVYGRRMVAAEFFCHKKDMLDPQRQSHACLQRWLKDGGYRIAPDPLSIAAKYAHMKTSPQRIQEARAAKAQV